MALLRDQPAGPRSPAAGSDTQPTTGKRVSRKVKDVNGAEVLGAIVSVEGQAAKATTAKDGSFSLKGVKPDQSSSR
ncbi:MAG: hypothetical protein IPP58_13700 [Holophagaceae bacterium]|uniref:Carboxypeptidase regulatory-like domain-containing protein n=1 Tax=Candidatus Geothrix skivensis TaxID=2954439 RepID=A0A9D7XHM1_9BACT|nr:hypothetical protein [Candidatus Geothrix skivensis]